MTSNDTLSTFGLTKEQLQILFSLECYLVREDVAVTKGNVDLKKSRWLGNYKSNLVTFLTETNPSETANNIYSEIGLLQQRIQQVSLKSDVEMWKYLVFLECVLFHPYFPMSEEEEKNKTYKGLKFDKETRTKSLTDIARLLGVNPDYIGKFEKAYAKTIKKMTGYWNKVLIGLGAGVVAALLVVLTAGTSIAALFAASGLYGAAAVSSGLAALGGGAIAVGGLGMAGGWAVLVGGGVLLGIGAGGSVGMAMASTSPKAIMLEAAKMWVVMKEILGGIFNDTQRILEILNTIVDKVMALKKEIAVLKLQQEENKDKIKNLKKSVSYLEKLLEK